MIRNILAIAGSDPSGGAGIQADIKAISANGGYAMAALTALTAQNTRGVSGIVVLEPGFVGAQIDAVFDDIRVDAVKIGMVANAAVARAVASALERHRPPQVVLDPVMVAKGGAPLLAPEAIAAVRDLLVPLASLITPNLAEAAALLDEQVAASREAMPGVAERLVAAGARAVLLKGGHLDGPESPDFLLAGGVARWFEGTRAATASTHGTGCTLSSALATRLALGEGLPAACRAAKAYVAGAIAAAGALSVGSGHGPTHHFHALWRDRA